MWVMNERLKQIRLYFGGSQKAFGERFGLAQQTYANYESGKTAIPDDLKKKIALLGINLHWLITGEGPMHVTGQTEESTDGDGETEPNLGPDGPKFGKGVLSELVEPYNPLPRKQDSFMTAKGKIETIVSGEGELLVPILSQRLSAGPGQAWLYSDFTEERLPLLSRFIKPYNTEDIFGAEVRGDSMTGVQLFDGDIAFFVRGVSEGDGIYVISVDGEVYIKRVEMDPFAKMLTIRSENERYQPKIVDLDRVVILGKVIGWLHHHPY
jgi:SOS-response transcriptional repressor LexA